MNNLTLLNEHVEMPGFPGLIVTRAFVHGFLRAQGWSVKATGFGSLDFAVFGHPAVLQELTDTRWRDQWLAEPNVRDSYRREA